MKDEQTTPVEDTDQTTAGAEPVSPDAATASEPSQEGTRVPTAEPTFIAAEPAPETRDDAFAADASAQVAADDPAAEAAPTHDDAAFVDADDAAYEDDAADQDAADEDAGDPGHDADAEPAASAAVPLTADGDPVQYGVGPFSLREVILGGLWLVAFVVSFFPVYHVGPPASVWTAGIDWVLTIGAPTVAVGLMALRRLSPDGIRRVGSLGIDQFASVAFSVAAVVWLGILWRSFVSMAGEGFFLASWVVWVEFFVLLGGVLLTVFAPFIAPFNEDFRFRREITAHRVASPARPVGARPSQIPDAAADPYASAAGQDAPYAAATTVHEPVTAPAAHQAFWALSPVERDVVDETGAPIFRIGPAAWALVIEDRGDVFVVRHEDGRIGYLNDVSGVTRG